MRRFNSLIVLGLLVAAVPGTQAQQSGDPAMINRSFVGDNSLAGENEYRTRKDSRIHHGRVKREVCLCRPGAGRNGRSHNCLIRFFRHNN